MTGHRAGIEGRAGPRDPAPANQQINANVATDGVRPAQALTP
jgi:hypothetical protein